jgi:hypothetical protein
MELRKRLTSKGASTNPGLFEIINDKDPLPVAGAIGANNPQKKLFKTSILCLIVEKDHSNDRNGAPILWCAIKKH